MIGDDSPEGGVEGGAVRLVNCAVNGLELLLPCLSDGQNCKHNRDVVERAAAAYLVVEIFSPPFRNQLVVQFS